MRSPYMRYAIQPFLDPLNYIWLFSSNSNDQFTPVSRSQTAFSCMMHPSLEIGFLLHVVPFVFLISLMHHHQTAHPFWHRDCLTLAHYWNSYTGFRSTSKLTTSSPYCPTRYAITRQLSSSSMPLLHKATTKTHFADRCAGS